MGTNPTRLLRWVAAVVEPAVPAWSPAAETGIRVGNDADVFPPVIGAAEGAQVPHHFDGGLAPGEDLVPGGAVRGARELWHQKSHC